MATRTNDNSISSTRFSIPNPDPTERTREDLRREISGLKEFYDAKFASYDKAIALIQANADKSPTISVVEEHVISLAKVTDERFRSISVQFAERDTRTEQTSRDSKVAVDAALQAAKEAVEKQNTSSALAIAKSETATAKQIDQLAVTFGEMTKAIDGKIDDIKDRLSAMDRSTIGTNSVASGQTAGSHATWGAIGAVIASVAAGLVIVQIFLAFIMKHM
jgi:hypothetical protein